MLLDYIFFLTALVFMIIYVSCLCVYIKWNMEALWNTTLFSYITAYFCQIV